MVSAWPEPVERVSSYLREAGAEARIEEFDEGARTAEAAAAAVGCELAQIVKSLVLVCDGKAVVALVPGDRRGDPAKVARATGADVARVASPEEVERATGFVPGAVGPFALARVETVILDRTLLRHPQVWVGGGSPNHLIGVAPHELVRLARARPMDVVQDDPYHSAADFPDGSGRDPGADPAEPKER
ncbi:MAG: YbaK/EbsC family protein [Actinobacteria bacterium]|nr:YbaK/EbsC family protein [Actinomycetota bacterium]